MKLKTKVYRNPLLKARGLMFTRPLKEGESLVLGFGKEVKAPIHMLFVFYPLDIIWVNSKLKVVDIRTNVKPFTPLVVPKARAQYIIEAKAGAAKEIKIGDSAIIKEKELEIRSK